MKYTCSVILKTRPENSSKKKFDVKETPSDCHLKDFISMFVRLPAESRRKFHSIKSIKCRENTVIVAMAIALTKLVGRILYNFTNSMAF